MEFSLQQILSSCWSPERLIFLSISTFPLGIGRLFRGCFYAHPSSFMIPFYLHLFSVIFSIFQQQLAAKAPLMWSLLCFFFLSTFNPHRAVSFRQLEPSLSIDSLVSPEPAKRDNTMSR